MDEGRLGAVRKSQKHNRKFTYVVNDIIKNRHELYDHCLAREQHEARSRLMAGVVNLRKSVVRNRVLLQCLQMKRQHGAILDQDTVKDKIDNLFSRPSLSTDQPSRRRTTTLKHQLSKSYQHVSDDEDDDFDIGKFPDPLGKARIALKLEPISRLLSLKPQYPNTEKNLPKQKIPGHNDKISGCGDNNKAKVQTSQTTTLPTHKQRLPPISGTANNQHEMPSLAPQANSPDLAKIVNANLPWDQSISSDESHSTAVKNGDPNPDAKLQKDTINIPTSSDTPLSSGREDAAPHVLPRKTSTAPPDANEQRPPLPRMKTLVLPPIKPTKEMVQRKRR